MGEFVTSRRAVATPESILANDAPTSKGGSTMVEETPATPPIAPKSAPVLPIHFVKNINPLERITFKDKTTFRFPRSLYICEDPVMAAKILEVADQYNIVIQ